MKYTLFLSCINGFEHNCICDLKRVGITKHNKYDGGIEFEGNLKKIYLKMKSNMNVRFSVPNAVDTSELSTNKDIELTFSSKKAIVLPKGTLAVD